MEQNKKSVNKLVGQVRRKAETRGRETPRNVEQVGLTTPGEDRKKQKWPTREAAGLPKSKTQAACVL